VPSEVIGLQPRHLTSVDIDNVALHDALAARIDRHALDEAVVAALPVI
jgi:hypothetical protein